MPCQALLVYDTRPFCIVCDVMSTRDSALHCIHLFVPQTPTPNTNTEKEIMELLKTIKLMLGKMYQNLIFIFGVRHLQKSINQLIVNECFDNFQFATIS